MDIVFERRKALTGAKLVPDLRRSYYSTSPLFPLLYNVKALKIN